MNKDIKILLAPTYEIAKTVNADITIEVEYGDYCVYGNIVTLAHHGPRHSKNAPCLCKNRTDFVSGTILISHIDLDTIGGIMAMCNIKPDCEDFWKDVAYIDVNGAHCLNNISKKNQDLLNAYYAWTDTLERVKEVELKDVTEKVSDYIEFINKLLDDNSQTQFELIENGKKWFNEVTSRVESYLDTENEYCRCFKTKGVFCSSSYYSPIQKKIIPAIVSCDVIKSKINISFCDGGKKHDAAAIARSLWGDEAGGRSGIAGSPRNWIKSEKELEYEYERCKKAVIEELSRDNILLTTLSKTSVLRSSLYLSKDSNKLCFGVQQQEPGAKYILSKTIIDKIVIVGSNETHGEFGCRWTTSGNELKTMLSKWKDYNSEIDDYKSSYTLDCFLYRLAAYVFDNDNKNTLFTSERFDDYSNHDLMYSLSNGDIPVIFISDSLDKNDNISGLIDVIKGTEKHKTNLYIDIQGGARTSVYVNNSILQLISRQDHVYNAKLNMVVATNYNSENKLANEIVDETDRFQIINLVSGMNAFFNYGKSDLLVEYLNKIHTKDTAVKLLVEALEKIDKSITFCRIESEDETSTAGNDLISSIQALRSAIKKLKQSDIDKYYLNDEYGKDINIRNVFEVLLPGIESDFGDLLKDGKLNIVSLVEWCVKKNNYITACSIAENCLPKYFVDSGILYYAKNEDELLRVKTYFEFLYSSRFRLAGIDKAFNYDDINHYFFKNYPKNLGFFFSKKDDVKPNMKAADSFVKMTKYFPVKFYTNIDEDSLKEIIIKYDFISRNRNCLAHANNDSKVTPETLKETLESLVKKLKDVNIKKPAYKLNDNAIANSIKKNPDSINYECWYNEAIYEMKDNREFGEMTALISKNRSSDVSSSFLFKGLAQSLESIKNNRQSFDNEDYKYMSTFVKDSNNEYYIRLLLHLYNNNKPIEEQLTYDELKKKEIIATTKKEYTSKDALDSIKKGLNTYSDFIEIQQHLLNEDSWKEYVEQTRLSLQEIREKNGVDNTIIENREMVLDVFSPISDNDFDIWRDLVYNAINTTDGIEIIKDMCKAILDKDGQKKKKKKK